MYIEMIDGNGNRHRKSRINLNLYLLHRPLFYTI